MFRIPDGYCVHSLSFRFTFQLALIITSQRKQKGVRKKLTPCALPVPWLLFTTTILLARATPLLTRDISVQALHVVKVTAWAWLQNYRTDGQDGWRWGTGLWRVSSPTENAALGYEAQTSIFISTKQIKAVTNFHEQKSKAISRLKEAGQRAFWREGLFADEHYAILPNIR